MSTPELVLADSVRQWTNDVLRGDPAAADAAADVAVRCYASGASVSDACEEARRFVGSWSRHPSHQPGREAPLRFAS